MPTPLCSGRVIAKEGADGLLSGAGHHRDTGAQLHLLPPVGFGQPVGLDRPDRVEQVAGRLQAAPGGENLRGPQRAGGLFCI